MNDSGQELRRSRVRKARHDLAAARKLASSDDPYLDVAVYHCQQAATFFPCCLIVMSDY